MRNRISKNGTLPAHPAVWWSRMKLRWPTLVWLLAAAGAVWLYYRGGHAVRFHGIVQTVHEIAAPVETARLTGTLVVPGQRVQAGMPLARFDTTLLDAEIHVQRMQAERQFDGAVLQIESELRTMLRRHDEAEAELLAMEEELARMEQMVERRLLDAQELARYRIRHRELSEYTRRTPSQIRELQKTLDLLRERKAAAERGLIAPGGTDDSGWLALRRERYTLRAQNDGIVSAVHAVAGNTVAAGEPVVTLVVDAPPTVNGFIPEWSRLRLSTGQRVEIMRPDGGRPVAEGRVSFVSPEVAALPAEMLPVPGRVVRGRQVLVEVDGGLELFPGETVHLYTAMPWMETLRRRWGRTR